MASEKERKKEMLQRISCPTCHKYDRVVTIMYGYPGWLAEALAMAKKAVLGGCVVRENAPLLHCLRCGKEFLGYNDA